MGPEICKHCNKLENKLLFTSWYCDCQDIKNNFHDFKLNKAQRNIINSLNAPSIKDLSLESYGILQAYGINVKSYLGPENPNNPGNYAKYWLECTNCGKAALFAEHFPSPGETLSTANGFFQLNHSSPSGTSLFCDACNYQIMYLDPKQLRSYSLSNNNTALNSPKP